MSLKDYANEMAEKSWQFWFRVAMRVLCYGILLVYGVFRISIPVINKEPVYLDSNDGYIILGCGAVVLAVEAVRSYIKRKSETA